MTTLTHIDTTPSDNNYTLHHTLEINRDGNPIGMLLVSEVNYQQFENELTSGRWVMRDRSYLWAFRRHLLDQTTLRARLNPHLDPFRGPSGKLMIIDDIVMDEDKPIDNDQIDALMVAVRREYASQSDFICSLSWRTMAMRLGISELRYLKALGPYRGSAISRDLAVGKIPLYKDIINKPGESAPKCQQLQIDG